MKYSIIIFFTFCISFTGISQDTTQHRESLVQELSNIQGRGLINGFSVGIVNSDSILITRGFGYSDVKSKTPYTKETIQPIASISKTVIGVALLKAQELGKLQLDDPINKHLPFKVINPQFPTAQITIRHLATHTSSIVDSKKYWNNAYVLKNKKSESEGKIIGNINDPEAALPLATFLKNVLSQNGKWYSKKNFQKTEPGAYFEYSNIAAALAAYIIEVCTEQSFQEFTKIHIFKPLEMGNTGWSFDTIDFSKHATLYANPTTALAHYQLNTYPDGGLRTNSVDLSLFLGELIRGYQGEGSLLTNASYKELFTKQLDEQHFKNRDKENPYNDEYNSGIFMGFSAKGFVGHTGSDPGVATFMFFDTNTMIGKILIVNTDLEKEGVREFFEIWKTLEVYENKF